MMTIKIDKYVFSSDRDKLDIGLIHSFLTNSYWAKGRTIEMVKKSIENSHCFAAYHNGKQVAFARVITDTVTFGYLADVFVIEKYRGKGISKLLMQFILEHPDIEDLIAIMLATADAHGLYEKFGFRSLPQPEMFMRRTKQTGEPENPKTF